MSARPLPAGALTEALLAERFPTYRATLHEAARKPGPVHKPGMDPAALVDDDLACARRRRLLCDALDATNADFARSA